MNWINRWFYMKKEFVFGGIQHLKALKLEKMINKPFSQKLYVNEIIGTLRRNKYESYRFILFDNKGFPRIKVQLVFNNGSQTKIIKDRYVEIAPNQIFDAIKLLYKCSKRYYQEIIKNKDLEN